MGPSPRTPNDNMEMVFLGVCLVIVALGTILFVVETRLIDDSHERGLPEWLNLTANSSHLLLTYDGTRVPGFTEIILTGTWSDPRTKDTRIIYETSLQDLQGYLFFPKFVTNNGVPMTLDAKVMSTINGRVQATHYIWSVSADPLSFIGTPSIEFLR